uniref:G_PROTEIN_RECEP_F1_2 domain-containing protein n=1 Tax=Rhabditophanes sp. KR3021 TaxID=114890 RepID=A0AC35UD08_9BILA
MGNSIRKEIFNQNNAKIFSLIMKLEFVFKSSYINKYYSCDYLTSEEWKQEENSNLLLGSIYITIGTFVMILYIPILYVLLTKDLLQNNFYKLILCITINDLGGLTMSSWACGIFTVKGYVFCSQPMAIYMVGIIGYTTWSTNSILAMVLAFNRCLDTINFKWSNAIFSGNKIYFWIVMAFSYGFGMGLCTPPMLYTSKEYTVYANWFVVINNITISVVLPSLYFILSVIMINKSKSTQISNQLSKMKKSLLLQSFLLCSITFCSALIYNLMQFVIFNQVIAIIGHLLWLCSTCVGAFVYLILNVTIRNHIIQDFVPASIKKCLNIKSKLQNFTDF